MMREKKSATREQTIVVAEDDEHTREAVAAILEEQGHRVLFAETSERLLFLALQRDIDAIFLSTALPGDGGVELCHRLRAVDETAIMMPDRK